MESTTVLYDGYQLTENVELNYYNWWNEALHGVGNDLFDQFGTYFRPPTEYSTVFPQIISLSASFDRDLFFRMANATGNEARAFYNAGNAVLTFWSPNINIYRDPRWGRGQETPAEDPYLTSEYARMFIKGLQGDERIYQYSKQRPVNGSPGRTYRFYIGEPVYPFGYGLSYTTFQYTFSSENNEIQFSHLANECLEVDLVVRNDGQRPGDHSVLWFVSPPNAGQEGRPIKNLVDFEKLHNVLPSESRQVQICLSSSMFQLANDQGEFEVILGEWTLMIGDQTRRIIVT